VIFRLGWKLQFLSVEIVVCDIREKKFDRFFKQLYEKINYNTFYFGYSMLREMINYSMIAEKKIKKQFIFTYIYFITTYISRNIQKLNDLVIVYFC